MALAIALLALPGCQEDATVGPTTEFEFNQARQLELVSEGSRRESSRRSRRRRCEERVRRRRLKTRRSWPWKAAFTTPRWGSGIPSARSNGSSSSSNSATEPMRGPLEQFDVSQLSLIGVVWNANNARALIQDPSGMSYIVAEGAKIGKNSGRVTSIDDNLVVVKETYVDFLGKKRPRTSRCDSRDRGGVSSMLGSNTGRLRKLAGLACAGLLAAVIAACACVHDRPDQRDSGNRGRSPTSASSRDGDATDGDPAGSGGTDLHRLQVSRIRSVWWSISRHSAPRRGPRALSHGGRSTTKSAGRGGGSRPVSTGTGDFTR